MPTIHSFRQLRTLLPREPKKRITVKPDANYHYGLLAISCSRCGLTLDYPTAVQMRGPDVWGFVHSGQCDPRAVAVKRARDENAAELNVALASRLSRQV